MKKNKKKLQCTVYGVVNFLIIVLVNKVSDLPVVAGNWEWKAALLADTETRLKIVSQLLLIIIIASVFYNFRIQRNKVINQ